MKSGADEALFSSEPARLVAPAHKCRGATNQGPLVVTTLPVTTRPAN
jgi:hypothetical protein